MARSLINKRRCNMGRIENLDVFEARLIDLVGQPTSLRPFVCSGSPLACEAFVVGFNPATTMTQDFWQFWRHGAGFDKAAWLDAYKSERARQPLRAGRTRRMAVSNTRRVLEHVIGAAAPVFCLETNIYSLASTDKAGLANQDRDSDVFHFLLNAIQPKVIVAHGKDAVASLSRLSLSAEVIPERHFSRGWSKASALSLGDRIRSACSR
jgi:hypothetical protein